MHFAVISGLSASLASLFGKLSGIPTLQDFWYIRTLCFIFMLICNAFVWTFYVKALHLSDSTLSTTIVSTGANYIFSAILGFLFFGELTSLFWWIGMAFVLLGLILIVKEDNLTKESKEKTT